MHIRVPRPIPQPLPHPKVQRHRQHRRANHTRKDNHSGREPAILTRLRNIEHPIAIREPNEVLAHRRHDHNLPADRLVTVNRIRDRNSRHSGNGETRKPIPPDDNMAPRPLTLIRQPTQNSRQHGNHHIRNKRRKPHLRLPYAPILPRTARSNPVAERARSRKTDQRTDCEREVGVPHFIGREEVGWRGEDWGFGQVEEEEQVGGAGDH